MCQSLNKKKRSKKTARDGQNKEKGRGTWRKIIMGADEEEQETKHLTLFKPSHTHSSTHILILTFDLSGLLQGPALLCELPVPADRLVSITLCVWILDSCQMLNPSRHADEGICRL